RMAVFLREILHPDGESPLLGDSCLNSTSPPRQLIAAVDATTPARPSSSPSPGHSTTRTKGTIQEEGAITPDGKESARVVGDYWVFRDQRDFLLFDAGPVAPDFLPAHGHCDLLGMEVSLSGRRFVVDSGVFNYEADAMRQYCRSTAAHNVLQIDDAEVCDVWSKFRMGYRGW